MGGHESDPLARYRALRDPAATPEPTGSGQARAGHPAGGLFVVQKHAARRLHWDFRLEHRGVLLSWAVPKGPSADPAERRLAIRTEDHPLDYADFEGVIPEGSYGHSVMARRVVSRVLTEKVEEGWLTEEEAVRLCGQLLRDNPAALYRLKVEDLEQCKVQNR